MNKLRGMFVLAMLFSLSAPIKAVKKIEKIIFINDSTKNRDYDVSVDLQNEKKGTAGTVVTDEFSVKNGGIFYYSGSKEKVAANNDYFDATLISISSPSIAMLISSSVKLLDFGSILSLDYPQGYDLLVVRISETPNSKHKSGVNVFVIKSADGAVKKLDEKTQKWVDDKSVDSKKIAAMLKDITAINKFERDIKKIVPSNIFSNEEDQIKAAKLLVDARMRGEIKFEQDSSLSKGLKGKMSLDIGFIVKEFNKNYKKILFGDVLFTDFQSTPIDMAQ